MCFRLLKSDFKQIQENTLIEVSLHKHQIRITKLFYFLKVYNYDARQNKN